MGGVRASQLAIHAAGCVLAFPCNSRVHPHSVPPRRSHRVEGGFGQHRLNRKKIAEKRPIAAQRKPEIPGRYALFAIPLPLKAPVHLTTQAHL